MVARLGPAVWLLAACAGRPAAKPVVATPPSPPACRSLDDARRASSRGRLREAATRLEPVASYCDGKAAKRLRAQVLMDLARYEEAGTLLEEGDPLRAEIDRRTQPATPERIALARTRFRAGLASGPELAPRFFLEAWELDRPNGLALIRAAGPSHDRALLERGIAELERETGRRAHAGLRAPPLCSGHFSNQLAVRWLPDGRHVVVSCLDGSAIVDTVTNARVANADARGLDEARLPRLRFTGGEDDITNREIPCSDAVRERLVLDATRGVLTWIANGKRAMHVLADVFRATVKAQREMAMASPAWSLRCLRDADANLAFVHRESMDPEGLPIESLAIYDVAAGRFLGITAGGPAHVNEDGRIVIRAPDEVAIFDPMQRTFQREKGRGADLAYDGRTLAFVKMEERDEISHPVWPFVRPFLGGADARLADFGAGLREEVKVTSWPNVGPFEPTRCAETGTMPTTHAHCAHPGIRLGGVDYDTQDELACTVVAGTSGGGHGEHETLRVTCRDPRGPVDTADPWSGDLVCRVGPHVLPLGACPHLLAER
ncbi:MAG: hypothetical protein U0270_14740 [Labilithrix sp.]